MKTIRSILLVAIITFFALVPFSLLGVQSVSAETPEDAGFEPTGSSSVLCEIFPFIGNIGAFGISSVCGGEGSVSTKQELAEQAVSLARLAASLIFVGIIIVAVYIVIKAALKYIRSEGDEAKITEAQKAIKSVFVGLIALFIGVIGLVLILVLFDSLAILNQTPTTDEVTDPLTAE